MYLQGIMNPIIWKQVNLCCVCVCVCVCVWWGGVWDGKSSTPHTNKLDIEFKPDFSFKYHS